MEKKEFAYFQAGCKSTERPEISSPNSSDWYLPLGNFLGEAPCKRFEVGLWSEWKTSWSLLSLWTLLSSLIATTCTCGFLQAEWFVKENVTAAVAVESPMLTYDRNSVIYTLGMFSVCFRDTSRFGGTKCQRFGGVHQFPTTVWQSSCFLYGCGCFLQCCAALVIFLSICVIPQSSGRRSAAHLVSHMHVVAGLLHTVSLLIYPIILDSDMGRQHCGPRVEAYNPDQCRVGWSYVAATAGTLLTFYCPFLAYFSFYRHYAMS